jgi:hypothetical protein
VPVGADRLGAAAVTGTAAARARPATGSRPALAFRPDRVYLGWQYALTSPEPGPPPGRPPAAAADGVSVAWVAAQHREDGRLARPHRLACATSVAAGTLVTAAWLTGLLNGALTVLAGAACLSIAVASARRLGQGQRRLRARLAAEDERVAGLRAAAERQQAARAAEHARQSRAWQQRSDSYQRQPQWYPVWLPSGIHRLDVAGGTLAGWAALLTSVAAPRLAAGGEVTVLDLTEGAVAGDLLGLARACGIDPLVWVLPADLPRLDLGAGLAAGDLAEVLAMTISASDDQGGVPGGSGHGPAGDPARDAALISRVLGVLRPDAGMSALLAALRALGQVGDPRDDVAAGRLTAGQLDRLAGLFGRGAAERVVIDRAWVIEARLRALDGLGSAPAALEHSRLRLAWLDRRAGAVGNQTLGAYLTIALTHALRHAPAGAPWQQTLVVLGAERLRPDVLDRLTDACEVARAGLVLGYRSIPAAVRDRLGRGNAAVAFMRLGNAQDARAAAEQIGTEHRFVVSQLTQTIGTSVTETTGGSYTSTVGTADSLATSESVTDTTGRSQGRGRSHARSFAPFGDVTQTASRDRSASRALSDSESVTRGINSSTAWGWSTSAAVGTNESLARGAQRSREFLVEQHELQQLPQSAVLLTYAGPAGRQVVLADANPAIIGLPTVARVSLDEARAAIRPAGQAGP